MARLVILSEGMTGRAYELKAEVTTVGRVEDNAFQIAESSVSSHHAEIHLRGNDVLIKDLGSTNGTFIEGQQIAEGTLKPGQILRFGQIQMRLESGTPAAPGKKALDHTMVIPQGVKLNELEQGSGKPVKFEGNTTFGKRSNKTNLIFIAAGVVLGLIIIVLLVIALNKSGQIAPPQ